MARASSAVPADRAARGPKAATALPETIDGYIAGFSPEVQAILRKIRATIAQAAPQAQEAMSYRIPTFKLGGNLVHFAAFKAHVGLFPPVQGDEKLMNDVAAYANDKGNLRFPLDEPIPYALIGRIVKARVRELRERGPAKSAR
jgi:uncharacterized protein YdhG (YjbR/CyaY superfamily)